MIDPQAASLRRGALRVVVVGGGITGLAAAHRLVEMSAARGVAVDLALLEARDRLGGTIATERAGGYLIEGGPDSFLTEKPWALALCDRLGLGQSLIPTRDVHRRTFLVHRGRLKPMPEGFQVLAPPSGTGLAVASVVLARQNPGSVGACRAAQTQTGR